MSPSVFEKDFPLLWFVSLCPLSTRHCQLWWMRGSERLNPAFLTLGGQPPSPAPSLASSCYRHQVLLLLWSPSLFFWTSLACEGVQPWELFPLFWFIWLEVPQSYIMYVLIHKHNFLPFDMLYNICSGSTSLNSVGHQRGQKRAVKGQQAPVAVVRYHLFPKCGSHAFESFKGEIKIIKD